jgi:hypothetical protein
MTMRPWGRTSKHFSPRGTEGQVLHTLTTKNPSFEGDLLHNRVHFHDGKALVDDELEIWYDTAEPPGPDGVSTAILHPTPHNAIALLVEQGCIDHGPLYTEAAQAGLASKAR